MQITVILFGMDYAKTHKVDIRLPHEMGPLDAAEYAFDLSNNPAREEDREKIFGRARSLSSGDVVRVEGPNGPTNWLCLPVGWAEVSDECIRQLEACGTWTERSEIARSYMQNHA